MAARRLNMAPRWPQDGSRWPQMVPRRPKMAPSPKTAQDVPRWPQDGPRWLQDGPKTAQDGPRWPRLELHWLYFSDPLVLWWFTGYTLAIRWCSGASYTLALPWCSGASLYILKRSAGALVLHWLYSSDPLVLWCFTRRFPIAALVQASTHWQFLSHCLCLCLKV